MPVHNGARYVQKAINSVLIQTYKQFELIIIDDASTDGSLKIIKEIAKGDKRIKVLEINKATGGPAIPRNIGMDMASGRFIAFIDCDDIWYSQKLERQLYFMLERQTAISFTAYQRIDENGICIKDVHIPKLMSYKSLLKNTAIATSSVMLDRSFLNNERFIQQGHEDYAFWLQLVKKYDHCYGLDEILLKYRVVEGSVSSRKLKSAMWVWDIYRNSEGLSIPYSIWCMVNYGYRATIKRLG